MGQQQSAADGVEGRLVYLAENLAALHAASSLPWIAGRFEFLGEKVIGAVLAVLALPDETGAYRAVASASPRVAAARALWQTLGIDDLASNTAAAAVFRETAGHARPVRLRLGEVFPGSAHDGQEDLIVAPISFSREPIGVGLFVVGPGAMPEMATILANHTAVAPLTAYKMGHFTLTAATSEAVNVTTINVAVDDVSGESANIYVKYGTQTTSVKPTVAATNSWSVNYTLPAGATIDVIVYMDIRSSMTSGDGVVTVDIDRASRGSTGIDSSRVTECSSQSSGITQICRLSAGIADEEIK